MSKLISARFIMAITFTFATCWMALKGKIGQDAFVPIVVLIVNSYFLRGDRPNEFQGNGGPERDIK